MRPKDLKFTVDQIRKDKVIYAMEACATNLLMLIILYFSVHFFTGWFQMLVNVAALLIAIGCTGYMGVGNFLRLQKIQQYDREIHSAADPRS